MLIGLTNTDQAIYQQIHLHMSEDAEDQVLAYWLPSVLEEGKFLKKILNRPWLIGAHRPILFIGNLRTQAQADIVRVRKGIVWHYRPMPSTKISVARHDYWVCLDEYQPTFVQTVLTQLMAAKRKKRFICDR